MRDTTAVEVSDLIEVDLGPRARGFFTTRGLRARPVSAPGGGVQDRGAEREEGATYDGWNLALHVGDDRNVFIAPVVGSRSCSGSSRGATWPG